MKIKRSFQRQVRHPLARHLFISGSLLILLLVLIGCRQEPDEEEPIAEGLRPQVTINEPGDGARLPPGQEVQILSTSAGQRGITQVELLINETVIRIDQNAQPTENTPFIVAQPWTPAEVGTYTIQVRATNTANLSAESAVLTVEVTADLPPPATPIPSTAAPPTATASLSPATATATPTEPPVPLDTATPTAEVVAPTATSTPTLTPLPLPAATFAPTGQEPEGRFRTIWEELGGGSGFLGHPTGAQIENRDFAKQYFDHGLMFWWDNPDGDDPIWVLSGANEAFLNGNSWGRYADTWDGDDTYSCDAARNNGGRGPVRGFGKVWCANPAVAAGLGNPTEPEGGSGGNAPYSIVQLFQGGVMVYNPLNGEVYILINDRGWQKFWY